MEKVRKLNSISNTNENIDVNTENHNSFAFGLNFFKLFWVFYIGCLAGVIVETIWCILTNGYFEYRTAMILEPLNPVYGFGALVITLILCSNRNWSNITVYCASFIIGGLFEASCSIFQELVFGTVSWMYKPSNLGILGNRTSLLYCFLWGFLGIFWVRLIYPFLSKTIEKIPNKIGKILSLVLLALFIFDALFSSGAVLRQRQRRQEIAPTNKIQVFYDNVFTDNVLKFFYHNITIID